MSNNDNGNGNKLKIDSPIKDISLTGAGFYSTGPAEIGQKGRLTFNLDSPVDDSIIADVTVMRCIPNTDANSEKYPYVLGCRFDDMTEESRRKLTRYIKESDSPLV